MGELGLAARCGPWGADRWAPVGGEREIEGVGGLGRRERWAGEVAWAG